MPGTICSVAICRSNFNHAKKSGEKIVFFSFPKNPTIREEWIKRCFRSDDFRPENKRVCSKHFTEDDYTDTIQARLMNTIPRRLKVQAIPSLNLVPHSTRQLRVTKRTRKKLAKDRIPHSFEKHANLNNQNLSPIRSLPRIQPKQENKLVKQTIFVSKSLFRLPQGPVTNLHISSTSKDSDYDVLKSKYDALLEENKVLKSQIEVHIRKEAILQEKIDELENFKESSDIVVLGL